LVHKRWTITLYPAIADINLDNESNFRFINAARGYEPILAADPWLLAGNMSLACVIKPHQINRSPVLFTREDHLYDVLTLPILTSQLAPAADPRKSGGRRAPRGNDRKKRALDHGN
jgi:hypothetical protein